MLKRAIVAIVIVAVIAGSVLYFGGFFKDGKIGVSGTVTKEYQWFTAPVENTWIFIVEPSGLPCASTITDENGMYAFEFVIGAECDFSGVVVSEGLWTIQAPLIGESRTVELTDGLQPVVDIVA